MRQIAKQNMYEGERSDGCVETYTNHMQLIMVKAI